MPNITQYTNPDTSINTEGFSQAARRIGAAATQTAGSVEQAGRELGSGIARGAAELAQPINNHIEYWDKTRVSTQATAGLADIEQQWQAKLKGTPDPNNPGKVVPGMVPADVTDPDTAKRFQRDVVEPFLEDLQKTPAGLAGAEYAQAKASEIRQHLSTSFAADMATQAGKAIQLSDQRTTDNLAALVAAKPSTSNVDMAIKQLTDLFAIHAGVRTLTADETSILKAHNEDNIRQVVHTAIASAIQQPGVDPEKVAKAFIDKYKDYVKPAEELQLARAATQQIKFNASLDRSAKLHQKEAEKIAFDEKATALQAQAVNPDGSHKVLGPQFFQQWKQLAQQPGADPAKMRALYEFGEHHDGTDRTYTDPNVGNKLASGIIDGTTTNLDLIDAFNKNLLSDKDFSQYSKNLKMVESLGEQKESFQATMKSVDELTIDRTAGPDPLGSAISAKIKSQFLPVYTAALQKKELPPNALDMTDPKSMIRQFIDPQLPSIKNRVQVQAFLAATGPQPDTGPGLLDRAKAWFSSKPTDNAIPVKDPSDVARMKLAPGTAIQLPDGSIRYVPAPKKEGT